MHSITIKPLAYQLLEQIYAYRILNKHKVSRGDIIAEALVLLVENTKDLKSESTDVNLVHCDE